DTTRARTSPRPPSTSSGHEAAAPAAPDAPPGPDPAELPLFRWALRLAFVVAVLGIIASVLHPQPEPDAIPPNAGSFLDTIITYDFWIPVHLAGITSYLLGVVVFMGLYRSMTEQPAQGIARIALAIGVASTAITSIWVAIDMVSILRLAELWEANPTEANLGAINAVEEIILALFSLAVILYTGLTFALFGLAMLHSRLYPKWVGMWGLLGGIASMLVGIAQLFTGRDALVTDILVPVVLPLVSVWFLVATVIMWRRVSAAAGPAAAGA
ncbi:MAG: DUF4386 family protein, partial [Solirubrobacteraceae bacterium]